MDTKPNAITRVLRSFGLGRILLAYYLLQKNYLSIMGWTSSVARNRPVDAAGEPIPWFTYGSISFLKPRIQPAFSIFEFGSGNSTLWFASLGCEVVSVEHDEQWYRLFQPNLAGIPRVKALLAPLADQAYSNSILAYRETFDIIVVDGRDRVECAKNSLQALKPNGVIIWDNSDRPEYEAGYEFLLNKGFKRIDFSGFGPINSRAWCTSVFYRPGNCLGI